MEYLQHGDLQRYLSKPFSEDDTRRIASQVVRGIGFMHRYNFIHRDLKPANLLVVDKPPEKDWRVKISDFGISKRAADGVDRYSTANVGTQEYMAPEVRFFRSTLTMQKAQYTRAADMWAIGAICVHLLTGNPAFHVTDLVDYYHRQGLFTPDDALSSHGTSGDGRAFVQELMARDPKLRLTAEQAVKYHWITD
ncbi:kinase-like domain-containing protein, partial [Chaetomium sp. MPI-SDFR-AT-0129]